MRARDNCQCLHRCCVSLFGNLFLLFHKFRDFSVCIPFAPRFHEWRFHGLQFGPSGLLVPRTNRLISATTRVPPSYSQASRRSNMYLADAFSLTCTEFTMRLARAPYAAFAPSHRRYPNGGSHKPASTSCYCRLRNPLKSRSNVNHGKALVSCWPLW